MSQALQTEALVFGRYLLGKKPDEASVDLYVAAQTLKPALGDAKDEKILNFALRHGWCLGALDGALALSKPNALLRRKLLVMSAVLENRPQYVDLFLPRERSFFYLVYIGWRGVAALSSAVFGKVILLFI